MKITHKKVEKYLLSMPGAKLDYPFGENTAVYKVKDKMFALVTENKLPVSLNVTQYLQKHCAKNMRL
jgi:predicted DNA-binding protein (MmcQ/YjbR family)